MKDWQKGYALEELKTQAARFIREFKPYSYGAFGIPKELAIADARAAGEYYEDPRGLQAIAARVNQKRSAPDWTQGRAAQMLPGDVQVKAAVCDPGAEEPLANWLLHQFPGRTIWWELHEENRALRGAAERQGFRHAFTKIMASSDLKGVYTNDDQRRGKIPALAAVDALTLGTIDAGFISADELEEMRSELAAFAPWAQHYSSYNKRKSWTAFAIRGYYDDPSNIVKPGEMAQGWKKEHAADLDYRPHATEAAARFPLTMKIIERIPGEKDRVRFSRVAGGGELSRHADITDREAGTADGKVARLHIPVITNPGAIFRGWDERGQELRMHMPCGGLYYIDQRKPHGVINGDPNEQRIHIMVDVFCGPELRRWLEGTATANAA